MRRRNDDMLKNWDLNQKLKLASLITTSVATVAEVAMFVMKRKEKKQKQLTNESDETSSKN